MLFKPRCQLFSRIMSTIAMNASYRTCVISDPSYMTSLADFHRATKNEDEKDLTYIPVRLAEDLYQKLRTSEPTVDFEVHSHKNDESFFAIGDISGVLDVNNINDKELKYIGSISSDSNLFVIAHDPTNCCDREQSKHTNEDAVSENSQEDFFSVDWEDFMLTILNDPTLQVDLESFPLYLMFGRIPEEDSILSVFGIPTEDSLAYSALILRSKDCTKTSLNSGASQH